MTQKHLKQKRRIHAKNVLPEQGVLNQKSGQQSSPIAKIASESSQSDERMKKKNESTKGLPLTAEEFDRRFDEGESVFDLGVDPATIRRPGLEPRRFNVDVPAHLLEKLDNAAQLRGITRQALVKTWLFDRLMQEKER
jgi:hypothetical protein